MALGLTACEPVAIAAPPYHVGGHRVAYVAHHTLPGPAGAAWSADAVPTIYVCPERMRALSPAVQHWIVLHELGHLAGAADELEADCYAARELAARGLAAWPALVEVVDWLASLPATDVHPPGVVRAARALECAP